MTDEPVATPDPGPDPAPPADPGGDPPAEPTKDDAPPADPGKGVLDPSKTDDPPAAPQANMPEDWRERIAGEDKKFLGHLKRYATFENFAKAGWQAQQKIRSGELKAPLPDDANEDDVKAYREQNGIPAESAGYYEAIPEGLVIGDDDKPYVDVFMEAMHGRNESPGTVNSVLEAYYGIREKQIEAQADYDLEAQTATEDALREELGTSYRREINHLSNHLAGLPEDIRPLLENARLGDDKRTPVFSHPGIVKWFLQQAHEANPVSTVVPAGGDQAQAIGDEIKKIENTMREEPGKYYGDQAMQDRYRELLTAQTKLKSKAA